VHTHHRSESRPGSGGGGWAGAWATDILPFIKTVVTSGAVGVTTWWQVTYMIIHPWNTLPFCAHRGSFAWEQRSWGIILSTQFHNMHALMTCIGTFYTCHFSSCHYIFVYCILVARYAIFLTIFFFTFSCTN